ncbi:DddA-like double-stranded DNA deaminase toxin [Amycolatopsis sp. lyj-23]|uniref:DddA-like double-stranded DNA deaminase toxin n=1 Tax=Amycolatopsis sp. lyj-23 TaxID=2789283 RepID=UPI0039798B4D
MQIDDLVGATPTLTNATGDIGSHVETKLAVHMRQAGLSQVTVVINHRPCVRHEVACVKWLCRVGGRLCR